MGSIYNCCSCLCEFLLYFFFIWFVTYNVNWLQHNRIFVQGGDPINMTAYHDPIEPSRSVPDLVTITGTSLYYNNKYIEGSKVIFKKGKKDRGFCVEID